MISLKPMLVGYLVSPTIFPSLPPKYSPTCYRRRRDLSRERSRPRPFRRRVPTRAGAFRDAPGEPLGIRVKVGAPGGLSPAAIVRRSRGKSRPRASATRKSLFSRFPARRRRVDQSAARARGHPSDFGSGLERADSSEWRLARDFTVARG